MLLICLYKVEPLGVFCYFETSDMFCYFIFYLGVFMAFLMKKHAGLALICALGLIGCKEQSQKQAASQPTQTNETTGFVSKLPADAPVIKVAMTGLGAPFSYKIVKGLLKALMWILSVALVS